LTDARRAALNGEVDPAAKREKSVDRLRVQTALALHNQERPSPVLYERPLI
jgi:hypothetical protein